MITTPESRFSELWSIQEKELFSLKEMAQHWKNAEALLAQDARVALKYAQKVLKGPFKGAEPVLAQDPHLALQYAQEVLKGPFPAAEATIATNAGAALLYAQTVLQDRFHAAEPVIAAAPLSALVYASLFIKGPWPEAEPTIATSATWSVKYSRDCIKGRWPPGEPVLANSGNDAVKYAGVIQGPFVLGESVILSSESCSEDYVAVLRVGEPTVETEVSLFRAVAVLHFVHQHPGWALRDSEIQALQTHWKQTIEALGCEPTSIEAWACAKTILFPSQAPTVLQAAVDFSV